MVTVNDTVAGKRKLRVAILFGGKSGEHEVSVASAQSVLNALDKSKYEPVLIAIDKQGRWLNGADARRQLAGGDTHHADTQTISTVEQAQSITALVTQQSSLAERGSLLHDVDVVFPLLHGPLGEDGTLQGLLELADLPYVGAGVAASAVGMDKDLMKKVFTACGLPCVNYSVVMRHEWTSDAARVVQRIEARSAYPVFVKPANMGSSVGISKAHTRAELRAAIDAACTYDRKVLVEQAVSAREVECSVLGNDNPRVSVVGEIRTVRRAFYDYVAKYTDGEAELIIPAALAPELAAEVRALALRAYKALDCAGMARVDFFIERGSDKVYVNELNTIPGFTRYSMYPKLWEASGLSYSALIDQLIELAMERHLDKKRSGL